jgi:2-polyprenyl-6-methoxyphenol hydroxylase-like FAD-dependent oxidoreductase
VTDRVLIAGAGPVGLVAAAHLVRRGIPVTVFEASAALSEESRASTFHPPTLDMLADLGAAHALIKQGLIAPKFQYRSKRDGVIAEFDFAAIADVTAHPYRVQAEQFKLTRILHAQLASAPDFRIAFANRVEGASQDARGVAVRVSHNGTSTEHRGAWLIGADGARSEVRRALGIEFEGFTWPERFLVVSTPFDFAAVIPRLASVSYVADPDRWHFLLRIPDLWRVMFPIAPEVSDEMALEHDYAQAALVGVVPGISNYEIAHTTLYRVHQRVAKTYRVGRVLLAGDAAHINNPLGGMGMNGGIHDAVNLTSRLARVIAGEAPADELDRYDQQRRLVTLGYVQTQSIRNKQNIEAREEKERDRFRDELRRTAADPALTRDYLLRVSMIASLKRAAELG